MTTKILSLTIKNKIVPYINCIEKDNEIIYYLGIDDISHIDNTINYFKKFNTIVEIVKK